MISKRSQAVNEPNTWGTWGGKLDADEIPEEALAREIEEETGYRGPYRLEWLYSHKDGDFQFDNYLIIVPHEFEPNHSWETSDHAWVEFGEWPKPLHFGMKSLIPHLKIYQSQSEALIEKMLLKTWDEYAKKVADAYQARPSMESQYLPSWKSLISHIEKMYDQMQSRITVEFTPEDPYKNEKEIIQDIEKNKRLKIYSGHATHPVWTVEQNLKFRAYHDYLSHVAGGHAFGSKGEIASYNQHAKMVPRDALLALFTEIIGQAMTATQTASFPEQKICKLHGFDYINLGKVDDQEYQRNFGG